MARQKIDYGIDLGTTNSAIARMDTGEIKIIKSDRFQKDTTPSVLAFTKKRIDVGDNAYQTYNKEKLKAFSDRSIDSSNSFIEFKRTMGTNKKYFSSNVDKSFSSEELSAEVLKKLQSYVQDENINAAVITVPNQFKQNQVDATQRAGELAGFQYCELLQEPIAASMAYGVDVKKSDGYWVVFDFGGGTFDTALMKVDEGIMKVVDTDGDNHLGGKNIDLAIVDEILIPFIKSNYVIDEILSHDSNNIRLKEALKVFAENIKIALSSSEKFEEYTDEPIGEDDNGEGIELELNVSLQDYEKAVGPIFQKAIDITKELISRNKLSESDVSSVLLVGGPTFSQTFRRMLQEQIATKIDTSIDPMTAVARGAALFASTKDIPIDLQERDTTKIQIILKYPETTVETEEHLGIRIDRDKTEGEIPEKLWFEVVRNDQGWSSGKVEIQDAEIISIHISPGKSNGFQLTFFDDKGNSLPCEPTNFTIIQGMKAANPTLPRSICIDVMHTDTGKQRLMGISGLAKNQTLPAKGKAVLKTQKEIRPGKKEDVLRIPILEGEPGERALYNQPAGIIKVTGEDLAEFLPQGSEVEITIEIDASRRIKMSAYFPYTDDSKEWIVKEHHDTEQTEYDSNELRNEINKAKHALNLMDANVGKLEEELETLSQQLDAAGNDYETKTTIKEHLSKLLKEIDKLEEKGEWPKIEKEIDTALENLNDTDERYGNQKTADMVRQLESQAQRIKKDQDVKVAKNLLQEIHALSFTLIRQDPGLWISYIKSYDDDFDIHDWTDSHQARQLINDAKRIIATEPSKDKLEAIVFALWGLLPEKDKPILSDKDKELLAK